MSNPYDDGLLCEHDYLIGPPCGDAATVIVPSGRALCALHFEEWLLAHPDAVHGLAQAWRIA